MDKSGKSGELLSRRVILQQLLARRNRAVCSQRRNGGASGETPEPVKAQQPAQTVKTATGGTISKEDDQFLEEWKA